VEGREFLRLFCALTLPVDVVDALDAWQRSLPRHGARVVERSKLHVTLAFLGKRPATDVDGVFAALRAAVASAHPPPVLGPQRYRETRSVGMLVLTDEDGRAGQIAEELHERLERLGVYEREARPWLPHVTVLRFRSPPRLRPPLPALEPFSPSGAAVYHSALRSGGAQYEVVESVRLGG
jgi:2'-5' RNA ligase